MDTFKFILYLSLFQLCQVVLSDYENIISIYNSNHANSCTSTAYIYSIDDIKLTDIIRSSTEVRFCSSMLTLQRLLIVKLKNNIKFSGKVILNCSYDGGLLFEDVSNLTLSQMQLVNCDAAYSSHVGSAFNYTASIFIINSTLVNITELDVANNKDTGLLILNTKGEVEVSESYFYKCKRTGFESESSVGIHLEFNNEKLQPHSYFKFINCHFGYKNPNSIMYQQCGSDTARQGGGMVVVLGKNSTNNTIYIQNTVFRNLFASDVGAMHIALRSNARENTIIVNNSMFENNTCDKYGGGGLRVDIIRETSDCQSSSNNISFVNSSFTDNTAYYGGGVFINSSKSINLHDINIIKFSHCNWTHNGALYGSALNALVHPGKGLARKLLLTPSLINCRFIRNYIREEKNKGTTIFGEGTVSLIHFKLKFEEDTFFEENIGSPIYLRSSLVEFGVNSTANFSNNVGLNGGAITILSHSAIQARCGSKLTFINNQAYFKGGAIYYGSIDSHDYLTHRKCFIEYLTDDQELSSTDKPTYFFRDNEAGKQFAKDDSIGKSIYATTLLPCNKQCGHYTTNDQYRAEINKTFTCVGIFKIKNSDLNRPFEIATSAWRTEIESDISFPLQIIPGKEYQLPIETKDELDQILHAVYKVILWLNDTTTTNALVASPYRYIHNRKIILNGKPSNAKLNLSLISQMGRKIQVIISVKIIPCPPGYILHKHQHQHQCRCSAELEAKYHYQGIFRCNATEFQAILHNGYWVGFSMDINDNLISSICPPGFCYESFTQKEYLLPKVSNKTKLDYRICGESRTGMLCADCRGNRSVYYHSDIYRCKSSSLCSVGLVFYAISELLPVTCVFLAVIIFDIKLTSGSVNGLILYYQLLDVLPLTAYDFIKFHKVTIIFYTSHRFLHQIPNLNFFSIDKLSFCLWKGATTLDIIAFKYFTVTYALLLVILTIFIMKMCSYSLKVERVWKRKRQITNSVIHGLSGFFILCYSQCTLVTLLLLKPVQYTDPHNTTNDQKYVLYQGNIEYLKGSHLKYALPAFFFLVTIVTVPPMLLISYPLCYKVLAVMKIEESKFSRILCKIVPLERLKPFFDSFQGSYKDKHRYTSGLYFIYRLISVCLAVSTKNETFFILLEIQLLVMIFVQSYFQPYKKKKHNRQDLFIFVNLAVINALMILNFSLSANSNNQQLTINVITSIQTLLLYLPTFYVVFKLGYFIFANIKMCCVKSRTKKVTDTEPEVELVDREEDDSFMKSIDYEQMLGKTKSMSSY